jgi:hypothetical protein
MHYANATDPSIPAALEPVALALTGLDNFRPRPTSQFHAMASLRPSYTSTGGSHYLVPADLGIIYDIAPLWARGIDGTGMKIAIAGQHDIDLSDVALFRSHYSLPNNVPQKVLVPGATAPDPSCCEAQLDLEYAGAMAPKASLIFVFSPNAATSAFYAIDQNLAPVLSYSFLSCEQKISSSSASANRAEAQKANAQGITWVASTGDEGAASCDAKDSLAQNGLAVGSPSSVPEVTAVGGTEFNEGSGNYWNATNGPTHASALSYIPERAWNDSYNDSRGVALSSTGGGASILYAKQSWQTGPGVPSNGHRYVPDISFAASPHHDGYWVGSNGTIECCWGGTSISTPIFAGVLAVLNQYQVSIHAQANPGLGNINPRLYELARTTSGIFNDVTVGDNIVPCAPGSKDCQNGVMGYATGPGYDQATGWGSADIYQLVTRWSMPVATGTATSTTVTADPTSIPATASANITATVNANTGSATPTGSVSFSTASGSLGSANLAGSGGIATASITVPGSKLASGGNTINASYSGDTTFNASAGSISVSVMSGGATPAAGFLTVVTATNKQVQLAWGAVTGSASYSVFRLPTIVTSSGLPGSTLNVSMPDPTTATPIATVNALTFTDTLPDPSATYTYLIRPGSGQLSNQVTVGPPPFGFNVVIPSNADNCRTFGVMERMELDSNGDPAIAYMVIDPNGDGDESDDTLYFVSWNRANYAWNPAVQVAVTGSVAVDGPGLLHSLARDAATGMWGLEYLQSLPEGYAQMMLATSNDNGVTWKAQSISGDAYHGSLEAPSLAMWNGAFHAIFLTDAWFDGTGNLFPDNGTGFLYVTGKVTDSPSKWTPTPAPFPGDYTSSYFAGSLALDSNHAPGIAFNVANDTYEGIAFWRPGAATSTAVAHNDGYTTNDNPSISLAFSGTQARIVTDAAWTYGSFDPDHEPADLWAMRAVDAAGRNWMPAVDVPPDNVNMMGLPWITTDSQGQTAIVMASNYDPEGQGMTCGFPKIARSNDFVTFRTCAPAPVDNPSFAPGNMHPVLRFGGNDKLWLAFNNGDTTGDLSLGLVLWREQ